MLGLAKYLPQFGWQPIILTAPLDVKSDGTYHIVETGYRANLSLLVRTLGFSPDEDIRKQVKRRLGDAAKKSLLDRLLTAAGEIVNYPDSEKGWRKFAVQSGSAVIRQEKIDAIISTSAPVTAHIIAAELKKRHQIPWLADLRDLWSQNHNYSYSRLRWWFDRRLELKTFSSADALITVSRPWADKLKTLHKNKDTYAITNGFDPALVNDPLAKLTDKLTITHTGAIYAGKQNPASLLTAARDLIKEGAINPDDIEIRFYGAREEWLEEEIEKCGLRGVARQYGEVSRDAALQKQRESQLLLLLNWDDPRENGNYPGKVFEYLAAGRPILATGGGAGDVVPALLAETGAGVHAPGAAEVKAALKGYYAEFKSQGRLTPQGDRTKSAGYSHPEMARKFARILDSLTGKNSTQRGNA